MMKSYISKVTLSYLLILLFAFHISLVRAEEVQKTLRIGWVGPLTGNSAVLGIDSARAVSMVFVAANGDPTSNINFEVIPEDDSYNTQKAVNAYQKLASIDKVPAILFLTYGGLFAVSPKAERDNILLIDPLDCNESVAKLQKNTLCIAAMTEGIGQLNVESALKNNHKKATILFFEDDPFMATVAKSSEEALIKAGAEVVLTQGYAGTQSDFRSILTKAKTKKTDSIYFYGYDEAATAMKQARELGIKAQFYATATVMSPAFKTSAGTALEGTKFSVFTPSNKRLYDLFITQFTKRYGNPPILDIATVPSYDIANLIVKFARNYKGDVEAPGFYADLRQYLYELKNYEGASGRISVGIDGATRTLTLRTYVVRNGERVIQ